MQTKRLLRPKQVADKLGCSMSHYYDLVKKGALPAPTKISPNISGTLESVIDDWIDEKLKAVKKEVA